MEVETILWPEATKEGIVMPIQTHSSNVRMVETGAEDLSDCDALMTLNRDLTIGVRTADCAAVAFSDGVKIAIAHTGWRGLCGGVIEHVLQTLPNPTEVYVGPHLHAFRIRKDFCYDAITARFGERFLEPDEDGYIFRFRDAIASCLPSHAAFDPRNTETDLSLPSHRAARRPYTMITAVRFA